MFGALSESQEGKGGIVEVNVKVSPELVPDCFVVP